MSRERSFKRLQAADVLPFLQRHAAVTLLDARDAQSHDHGHLAGSLRLDERNHEQVLLSAPRRQPVLIYCYHGNASQTYAQMFVDFGFTEVYDLIGGYEAWERFLADRPCGGPAASGIATSEAVPSAPAPQALSAWLAAHGFSGPDVPGRHGNTPLMEACWRGAVDIVEALLAQGVQRDATNGDGNNALWLACVHGDAGLIRQLVAAGVPIDHLNDNGASCLMYAASAGKPAVVATLLELGANPELRSLDDFTALDMAASVECLNLLRRARARTQA